MAVAFFRLGEHVVEIVPLKGDEDLRFGRFGFDQRVDFVVEADEVRRVVGMRVHVGVDLGGETEIARLERAHDPQRVIAIRGAHIGIRKIRLPAGGQADEIAAIESVERIEDEDIFKLVLIRKFDLVDEVSVRLRFALRAVDEILPRGGLLDEDEISVLTHILIQLENTLGGRFGWDGEESVGGFA